jgi:hypothetical protein
MVKLTDHQPWKYWSLRPVELLAATAVAAVVPAVLFSMVHMQLQQLLILPP